MSDLMGEISATIFVRPETLVEVFDKPHRDRRVVGVHVGGLSVHLHGDDEDIIATTTNVIDALSGLRDSARDRGQVPQ